jgi:hypothetical protein
MTSLTLRHRRPFELSLRLGSVYTATRGGYKVRLGSRLIGSGGGSDFLRRGVEVSIAIGGGRMRRLRCDGGVRRESDERYIQTSGFRGLCRDQ